MNDIPLLTANNICLTYKTRRGFLKSFTHNALNDISIELSKGDILGILGRNGGGKSSLLRILAGIIKPTSGSVICQKHISRSLLSLGVGFMPGVSGKDNALYSAMLQGVSQKNAKAMLPEIEEFSDLGEFFTQPMSTYSSGMKARLGFATAIMTDVDIIFLDEVLSVGDAHFRKKAEDAMLKKISSQQAAVFVSHNPEQVKKICTRAIWLENGSVKESGDTETVSRNYHLYMNK